MIGRFRPLARYEAPMSRMHRTGEVEAFVAAVALSFPRGESETPSTVIVGVDGLQRVVGLGQHSRIRGAGETRAASAELRLPEAWLVRLVADADVLDLAIGARDLGEEGNELIPCRGGVEEGAGAAGRDHDRDANPGSRGVRHVAIEYRLLPDRRRVVGVPGERDPILGQADVPHGGEEGGAAVLRQLSAVVRHADTDVCRCGRGKQAAPHRRRPAAWLSV